MTTTAVGVTRAVLVSEQIDLVSAGVDIGSATCHLMLSRLTLRRRGPSLSSGFAVVVRDITYRSPVRLTPFLDGSTIDTAALRDLLDSWYAEAGVTPDDIDTGAVIVTGEAARKRNARAIGDLIARHSGRFVCAVAGPLLEARLGVQGSGADALSRRIDEPLVCVDVGGGTTKISLLRDGAIERIAVVNVGARLLAWDPAGRLVRVERAGRAAARACGAPDTVGESLSDDHRRAIAGWLADRLIDHLHAAGDPGLVVAGVPFAVPYGTAVVVSGGVGEYVYGLHAGDYGDLGPLLGAAIRDRLGGFRLLAPAHRLRATVIGASQYTVQVSGNTVFVADPSVLPLFNLPVVHVRVGDATPDEDAVAAAVTAALAATDARDAPALALACHTRMTLSYPALSAFARGLARALEATPATLAILLEQDCAGLLGHLLRPMIPVDNLLCVDQVAVADLDYVDLGSVVESADAVPVIAKSLIFSG